MPKISRLVPIFLLICLFFFIQISFSLETVPLKKSNHEVWSKSVSVSFQEVLRIGSDKLDEENYIFGIISDIKVDKEGFIYVLDSANYRIQKFSPKGLFITSYGNGKGEGPGQFLRPKSIALDDKMNLYVADTNLFRITVFDPQGKVIKTIRTESMPANLSVKNDYLFLIFFFHEENFLIYRYNVVNEKLERKFCESNEWTYLSAQAGEAGELCMDMNGNLYYSHTYPYEIKKFSLEGELLARFSRKATFYKAPYRDPYGIFKAETAPTALFCLPDGTIVNVIRHIDRGAKKGIFYFDFFDKEGNWLKSLTADSIGLDWIRIITADNQGNIYLDCKDPFPHVRKYELKFIKK